MSKVKYLNIVMLSIGLVFTLVFFFGGSLGLEPTGNVLDFGLRYTYVLFVFSVLVVTFFILYNLIISPIGLKSTLMTVVITLVLFGIGYLLSPKETIPDFIHAQNTASICQWTSIGFIIIYILFILSFLALIVTEVINAFK